MIEGGATQRWRLDLAYDGTSFNGFAYQPDVPTVVGLLRSTLQRTLQLPEEPHIVGAGRTDTGVHAYAQVVHVDLPDPLFRHARDQSDAARLTASLNVQLRGLIQVRHARVVPDTFHARYSAQWREYRYLVVESPVPPLALEGQWSWGVAGPLDLAAMNQAAAATLGEHDFRAFCRRPINKSAEEPLVRHVLACDWAEVSDPLELVPGGGRTLKLTIRARSFCHNMVRCLTGTMVAIGRGKLPVSTMAQRLASHDRRFLPPPAPPQGLCLVRVGYEEFAGGVAGSLR